eukprot:18736-Heterococcus_DN1.PRE.6
MHRASSINHGYYTVQCAVSLQITDMTFPSTACSTCAALLKHKHLLQPVRAYACYVTHCQRGCAALADYSLIAIRT